MRRVYLFLITTLINFSLTQAQKPFTDVTHQAGIDHQFKVYEGMFGGGACVLDVNHDDWEDVYLTSGMNNDALYLNQRDGTFKNIFEQSGLTLTKHFVTQGVVSADFDKDGWEDLFITTITSRDSVKQIPRAINLLFLNNHDGTFRDATSAFRLDKMNSFSTGASVSDINQDGYPDMYIGNYFHEYQGELSTISDATIVNANQTARGYLLLNHKGKYFSNVYDQYGMHHKGFGFGGIFTDYDNDGDQDLFINQDFGYKAIPDYLYQNQYPQKKFVDVSDTTHMDLKINSMGTAVGDYDNDGDMDYYVTNIRFNYFMVNHINEGLPVINKLTDFGMNFVSISWGGNFADFDQDGDLDLYVANGDLNPNCVPKADFYYKNDINAGGRFADIAGLVGLNDYGIGRGSVTFDYDHDGDLDILVINQKPVLDYPVNSNTHLYRNDSTQGNWFQIKLHGTQSETSGIGSRVEIVAGHQRMIREVDGGSSSHLSQNSTIVHFGLGTAAIVDSVIVIWNKHHRQGLANQKANQMITIEEAVIDHASYPQSWLLLIGFLAIALIYFVIRKITK
ncbi:MAG: CRTAC1 family protein [Saprospiraceae bacterium]|nr:CRTAC1 family protein [Saprospiraceae bacterium]